MKFAVQVSHKMIVSNLFQLERDVDFPPVAFGNLVDAADRDVILLGRRNSGLIRGKILKLSALRD